MGGIALGVGHEMCVGWPVGCVGVVVAAMEGRALVGDDVAEAEADVDGMADVAPLGTALPLRVGAWGMLDRLCLKELEPENDA